MTGATSCFGLVVTLGQKGRLAQALHGGWVTPGCIRHERCSWSDDETRRFGSHALGSWDGERTLSHDDSG